MPLQATSGAASYDGFGGGVPFVPTYIEDVFSTYLYTGNGSTQTITNGIDLSTKGGLVWIKGRSVAYSHAVFDTARGATNRLVTNATDANSVETGTLTAFNSTGFALGSTGAVNNNGTTFASWTFRKQPKFFDVVTYTGDGNSTSRNIAHDLGSVAGTIIVKRTDSTSNWAVAAYDGTNWKVGTTTTPFALNLTNASTFNVGSVATSTTFNVCRMQWSSGGNPTDDFNASGATYVAYLFAHNAGGFGLTGTDNVISCGSYSGNNTTPVTVTLGYEPQWILIKRTNLSQNWTLYDNMRGIVTGGADPFLRPNTSDPEVTAQNWISVTATGFQLDAVDQQVNVSGSTYIYVAIRRGPMKTPTTGTSVYYAQAYADASLGSTNPTNLGASAGFPVDFFMHSMREETTFCSNIFDRLRGSNPALITSGADAESTGEPLNAFNNAFDIMSGVKSAYDNRFYYYLTLGRNHIAWMFRRAPGFFDTVCYTGTGGLGTVTHNLGAVPELMIVKSRSNALDWIVYSQPTGNNRILKLNSSGTGFSTDYWQDTTPTATSVFLSGVPDNEVYGNGITYVMYLFASCPGVSKVGSYTGTGTTLQVNCGFTGGARFVLIKRTDDSGDWYVWDSARGIVAGSDPYLTLNTTAAEVTTTDWVDTYSAGFELSNAGGNNVNINGAAYIFLSVA